MWALHNTIYSFWSDPNVICPQHPQTINERLWRCEIYLENRGATRRETATMSEIPKRSTKRHSFFLFRAMHPWFHISGFFLYKKDNNGAQGRQVLKKSPCCRRSSGLSGFPTVEDWLPSSPVLSWGQLCYKKDRYGGLENNGEYNCENRADETNNVKTNAARLFPSSKNKFKQIPWSS